MAHDLAHGLTARDLEAFLSGNDTACWKLLGSNRVVVHDDDNGDIAGTRFAVWAPNAQSVQVISDFNSWTGEPMHLIPGTGVWALFVAGDRQGAEYRYNILGPDGVWREKVDPMARYATNPPRNTSVVHESRYTWHDDEWLASRTRRDRLGSPMSIYEVHLGSWRRGKTYDELATELVDYVTRMGFTHVEFMPITEYPLEASWGYQVTNYFAPTARLGRPDELRHLIDRLHQAGIGVILDWVPAHYPKDDWALGRFDGTALYEHADPRQGEHKEWGTLVFNYGRYEVKSFLTSNALYWIGEFHFDGIRFDAVASMLYLDYARRDGEWVPNKFGGNYNLEAIEFLKNATEQLHEHFPGVLVIAEESTAFPKVTAPVSEGGLGFDFKWNMGWMNDSLRYLKRDPLFRQYHHNDITFGMMYQYSENYILPISHDEVVHEKCSMINKPPQESEKRFASLRAFYSYMWCFPGKKLLFMGCEFGQPNEWDEKVSLDWPVCAQSGHRGLQRLIADLNTFYWNHPALWKLDTDRDGFLWLNPSDCTRNTFSWLRSDGESQRIACIINFSPVAWPEYRIGLPATGTLTEIFNSDATCYDGSGSWVNESQVTAESVPYLDFPASATIVVPPLSAVFFSYQPDENDEVSEDDQLAAATGSRHTHHLAS